MTSSEENRRLGDVACAATAPPPRNATAPTPSQAKLVSGGRSSGASVASTALAQLAGERVWPASHARVATRTSPRPDSARRVCSRASLRVARIAVHVARHAIVAMSKLPCASAACAIDLSRA